MGEQHGDVRNECPNEIGVCEAGEYRPTQALRTDDELRQMVLQHCRWMHGFDKQYAIWAFDNYAAIMPWLKLERKR